MRTLLVGAILLAAGCWSAPPPKPAAAPFSLAPPRSLELLHGQTVSQDVAVRWDAGEREDLEVSAAVEPDGRGVSVAVEPTRLERGAGPARLAVSAAETAAGGDYAVTVTAKAVTSGKTAKGTVTVKLPRKD